MEQKMLAVHGGEQTKTKSFHRWPYCDEKELANIKEVLDEKSWWRVNGRKIEEFETKFAKIHGVKYCLGVSNGTHALEIALQTLGIGRGDEVIVPAFTFISTASAVIYCNAEPVLADVKPDTFCMDPESFQKAITSKTKAVIPVHMAGYPCDMEEICRIAHEHGIKVIEDAAHAHGGEWKQRKIGSFGDMAAFSFQNGKIMTCGEGGALITNKQDLYDKAYLIHGVGRPREDTVYEHKVLGSNNRMNEFQAAVLLAQMERLNSFNWIREQNARKLDGLLKEIEGIIPQAPAPVGTVDTHYMYMFYYDKNCFGQLDREDFVKYMNAEGIPCFIAYPVISDTQFFQQKQFGKRIKISRKYGEGDLKNARRIAREVVWLPHYTLLGDDADIVEIVTAILKIKGNC